MKGQFSIEFVVSVLVFSVLASYVAFFVYNMLPVFSLESEAETLRAKAFQISDLILGDPGQSYNLSKTNITITAGSVEVPSGYQLMIKITDPDILQNSDNGRNIKFYSNLTRRPYTLTTYRLNSWWDGGNSNYTIHWLQLNKKLAPGESIVFYMYYGNAGFSGNWERKTFDFMDSFDSIIPSNLINNTELIVGSSILSMRSGMYIANISKLIANNSTFEVRARFKTHNNSVSFEIGNDTYKSILSLNGPSKLPKNRTVWNTYNNGVFDIEENIIDTSINTYYTFSHRNVDNKFKSEIFNSSYSILAQSSERILSSGNYDFNISISNETFENESVNLDFVRIRKWVSDIPTYTFGPREEVLWSDSNWVQDNVRVLGLSLENEPYVINYTKLLEFNNTTLGLRGRFYPIYKNGFYPDYDMGIIFENATSSKILANFTPTSTAPVKHAVNIIRTAPMLVDNKYEPVRLILTVWKP